MKSLSLLILSIFIFIACEPSDQEKSQMEQREQQMQMQLVETTPEFNSQMDPVLNHYFDLKDALVNDDSDEAQTVTESLISEVERVQQAGLTGETLSVWTAIREQIISSGNELNATTELEEQRIHFETISEAMINMMETFEPVGYEVYQQSCPMVRGGSADWLSREEEIKNPYHGERMLNCGEVIRRI